METNETLDLDTLIARAGKINLSHNALIADQKDTEVNAVRQDLVNVITPMQTRAEMGELTGNPEQLSILRQIIEGRAEAVGLLTSSMGPRFKQQLERAFAEAKKALQPRRE